MLGAFLQDVSSCGTMCYYRATVLCEHLGLFGPLFQAADEDPVCTYKDKMTVQRKGCQSKF